MSWLRLFLLFTKEFLKANWTVAKIVLGPVDKIQPAIVKVPVDLKSETEVFMLSSLITLTPGTLSLSFDESRRELFVHVIHTEDPEGTVREIKEGFERSIQEAFS